MIQSQFFKNLTIIMEEQVDRYLTRNIFKTATSYPNDPFIGLFKIMNEINEFVDGGNEVKILKLWDGTQIGKCILIYSKKLEKKSISSEKYIMGTFFYTDNANMFFTMIEITLGNEIINRIFLNNLEDKKFARKYSPEKQGNPQFIEKIDKNQINCGTQSLEDSISPNLVIGTSVLKSKKNSQIFYLFLETFNETIKIRFTSLLAHQFMPSFKINKHYCFWNLQSTKFDQCHLTKKHKKFDFVSQSSFAEVANSDSIQSVRTRNNNLVKISAIFLFSTDVYMSTFGFIVDHQFYENKQTKMNQTRTNFSVYQISDGLNCIKVEIPEKKEDFFFMKTYEIIFLQNFLLKKKENSNFLLFVEAKSEIIICGNFKKPFS